MTGNYKIHRTYVAPFSRLQDHFISQYSFAEKRCHVVDIVNSCEKFSTVIKDVGVPTIAGDNITLFPYDPHFDARKSPVAGASVELVVHKCDIDIRHSHKLPFDYIGNKISKWRFGMISGDMELSEKPPKGRLFNFDSIMFCAANASQVIIFIIINQHVLRYDHFGAFAPKL